MEFGVLLRLVGVINLILILSCPVSIQGREPYLRDCQKKKKKLVYIQTFADQLLSNLV